MKKITTTLLACFAALTMASAQDSTDCSKWITTDIDKMDGTSTTRANNGIVISGDGGKTGIGILMLRGGRSNSLLILSMIASGEESGCIDDHAKVNILFRDGSRMELFTDNDFNCEGKATVYFGGIFGRRKQLDELKEKKIATIRIWTRKSYVQQDLTTENSDAFYHTINCLTK